MADPTIPPPPPGFTIDGQPAAAGPVYGTPPNPPEGFQRTPTGFAPVPGGPADPMHTPAAAPSGFRFKPDGTLEGIPGGPSDPKSNGQSLSPDAVNAETTNWLLSGKMSSLGMGGGPIRVQILNNRPVLMQKYGISDNQLPAIQREFNSDADTFAQRNAQLSYMKQSSDTLNQHIQGVAEAIRNLPMQSSFAGTNAIATGVAGAFSNKAVTDLQGQIPILEGELGRYLTGNPTNGAGQLTDEARKEFAVISGNASPEAKISAMNSIVQMAEQKAAATQAERNRLEARMNGGLGTYAHDILGQAQQAANPQGTNPAQGQQQQNAAIPIGAGEFGPQNPGGYLPPGADKFPAQLTQALQNGEIPPDPYAIMGWAKEHGGYTIPFADAKAGADALKKGIVPPVGQVEPYKPDITDVRGGQNTQTQDQINSGVRGVVDAVSLGSADKLIAGADTLFKGGSMDQNLARQYAISDFDQQNHPVPRFGGQVLGGALLPLGEVGSLGNLALKGAGYGAAYGAGSSRSLADVPTNALLGATAGAAVPAAIGGIKAGRGAINALRGTANAAIPPLVDPATGELNQVLDKMNPAGRYQALKDAGIQNPPMAAVGGRTARVIDQGFSNLPPSAGLMEDASSAVAKDARAGMNTVAGQYGTAGTLNEAGTSLQAGVNQWLARAEGAKGTADKGLVGKVYDAIPIKPTTPAVLDNTRSTLQSLTSQFQSNPDFAEVMQNPKLARYLDALTPKSQDVPTGVLSPNGQPFTKTTQSGGGLSWNDLKAFRSEIGQQIGDRMFIDGSGTTGTQLRTLYGALSEDMRATATQQGSGALAAFNRANSVYDAIQTRKEQALVSILGPDALKNPEAAAAAVQKMSQSSGGDLGTLAQVRASMIKSGQWGDVASTLIRMGGLPGKGEGRVFNPQTFLNWYSGMTNQARGMIFGGGNDELRQSLDKFVAATQQLSRVKSLSNTSNTTPTFLGAQAIKSVAGAGAGVAVILHPLMATVAAAGIGAGAGVEYGLAKLWTNPKFVQIATGYARAASTGNANAVRSQVGRLTKLATTNPELRSGIESVIKAMANDNAPAVGQIAASPNQGPQQQGQPQQ